MHVIYQSNDRSSTKKENKKEKNCILKTAKITHGKE